MEFDVGKWLEQNHWSQGGRHTAKPVPENMCMRVEGYYCNGYGDRPTPPSSPDRLLELNRCRDMRKLSFAGLPGSLPQVLGRCSSSPEQQGGKGGVRRVGSHQAHHAHDE